VTAFDLGKFLIPGSNSYSALRSFRGLLGRSASILAAGARRAAERWRFFQQPAGDTEKCTGPDLTLQGEGWPLDRGPYYLESNVPGLFAAGDVRHGSVKRCASSVGEGAMAVTFMHRYLAEG
jgi:hypothetical protein